MPKTSTPEFTKQQIRHQAQLHLRRTVGALIDTRDLSVKVLPFDEDGGGREVIIIFKHRNKRERVGMMVFSNKGIIKSISAHRGIKRRMKEVRGR